MEKVQENINKAREHQLQEEGHALERQKLAMEHKKIMHGAHADEEAARAAAALLGSPAVVIQIDIAFCSFVVISVSSR